MTEQLHLSTKHRRILESLLREHLPHVEVWAYGSRVTGRSHDGSDLDLVLRGPELKEIPYGQIADFEDAVRESRIPFLVEARDWVRLPERFHREIDREYLVLRTTSRECAHRCEWRAANLGSVCSKIGSGATPRGGRSVYLANGPFTLIRSQNIRNEGFDRDGLVYIDHKQASALDNVDVHDGDVLLNITGDSVARISQAPSDVLPARVNQHVAIIRPDPTKLDAGFLRYTLVSQKHQAKLLSWAGAGGTRNALTKRMIESFEIALPPIPVQRTIAHILGTLDDKIEINRRMNKTLEAIARALFKSWFVDFDPVRAKMNGRDTGLSKDISDLFPESLDDSKKPNGWGQEASALHITIEKGLSYKGAGLTTESHGIPLHNLNSILKGGGYKTNGLKFYTGDYSARHIVKPFELLVANTDLGFDHLLIGYSALVPAWTGQQGLFSHHLFKVTPRPDSPLSSLWLHFALSTSPFGETARTYSNGTTINMLPQAALKIPEIVVPPNALVEAFDKVTRPMLESQENSYIETCRLVTMRDTLLPNLVSGNLRLAEAEETVQALS